MHVWACTGPRLCPPQVTCSPDFVAAFRSELLRRSNLTGDGVVDVTCGAGGGGGGSSTGGGGAAAHRHRQRRLQQQGGEESPRAPAGSPSVGSSPALPAAASFVCSSNSSLDLLIQLRVPANDTTPAPTYKASL